MLTCSQGCWYTHAHYKDMDDVLLKTKTVKTVVESIQAASAYVIKTIRGTNGEEVLGGTGTEAQKAALSNVDHLTNSFISLITFAWNGVRVGWTLNERLGKTEHFSSLVPEIPIMGHVMPQFIKKTAGPKSCSSVLLHLNGKVDQDRDVTKKVDLKQLILALGIKDIDMGTHAETYDRQQESLLKENAQKESLIEENAKKGREIEALRLELERQREERLLKAAQGVTNEEVLGLKSEVDALKRELELFTIAMAKKDLDIEMLKEECKASKLAKEVAIAKYRVKTEELKSESHKVDLPHDLTDFDDQSKSEANEVDQSKLEANEVDLTNVPDEDGIGKMYNRDEIDLTHGTDDSPVYFQIKGLHYMVEDVSSDESCLFHSLARIPMVSYSTGHDVRAAIVSYVTEGKAGDIVAKADVLESLQEGTKSFHEKEVDEWAKAMKNTTRWGSTWETAIFAVMCEIEIITVTYLTSRLELVSSKETLRMNKCKVLSELITDDTIAFYVLHHKAGSPEKQGDPKDFNHFAYLHEVVDEKSILSGAIII